MTHSGEEGISFGELMRDMTPRRPDVFVLTARSAVPLADALRGWYDMTGEEMPEVTYVRADRELSKEQLLLQQRKVLAHDQARLRDRYQGCRAVLIDQWVHTGRTLRFAARCLEAAGVEVVGSCEDVRWYSSVSGEIDLDLMTSPEHADFMRRVGRESMWASSPEYLNEFYGDPWGGVY